MKNSLILSAILGAVLAWEDTSKEQTVYSRVLETKDKKFNIIQLGDLNYSSQDDYEETTTLINNLIRVIDPQLVVITGDIVNPSVAQAATYNRMHHEAMRPILDAEIPWLWTGGANVSGLSRDQLLGID
jgi:predicted MPP superfamily phosphohydrolase